LGAIDGFVISGLAIDNNDALSRRDAGLEFLDVTSQLRVAVADSDGGRHSGRQKDEVELTNKSSLIVDTHPLVIVEGLSPNVRLLNASGTTSTGEPYLRVFLPNGVLNPGDSIVEGLIFLHSPNDGRVNYSLRFLSGQGNP
jgi:hypothetical protein